MTTPTSGGAKTPEKPSSRIERIAVLNDKFRAHVAPAQTYVTMDLVHRGNPFLKKLVDHVKAASAETPEDETDYERDYGSVTVNGVDVDWSIHYSDSDGHGDSPDPSNPSLTMRTLALNSA